MLEAETSAKEFDDFTSALKSVRPHELKEWEKMYNEWFSCEGWNLDNVECPFYTASEGK
jgi:hypothetical protein